MHFFNKKLNNYLKNLLFLFYISISSFNCNKKNSDDNKTNDTILKNKNSYNKENLYKNNKAGGGHSSHETQSREGETQTQTQKKHKKHHKHTSNIFSKISNVAHKAAAINKKVIDTAMKNPLIKKVADSAGESLGLPPGSVEAAAKFQAGAIEKGTKAVKDVAHGESPLKEFGPHSLSKLATSSLSGSIKNQITTHIKSQASNIKGQVTSHIKGQVATQVASHIKSQTVSQQKHSHEKGKHSHQKEQTTSSHLNISQQNNLKNVIQNHITKQVQNHPIIAKLKQHNMPPEIENDVANKIHNVIHNPHVQTFHKNHAENVNNLDAAKTNITSHPFHVLYTEKVVCQDIIKVLKKYNINELTSKLEKAGPNEKKILELQINKQKEIFERLIINLTHYRDVLKGLDYIEENHPEVGSTIITAYSELNPKKSIIKNAEEKTGTINPHTEESLDSKFGQKISLELSSPFSRLTKSQKTILTKILSEINALTHKILTIIHSTKHEITAKENIKHPELPVRRQVMVF